MVRAVTGQMAAFWWDVGVSYASHTPRRYWLPALTTDRPWVLAHLDARLISLWRCLTKLTHGNLAVTVNWRLHTSAGSRSQPPPRLAPLPRALDDSLPILIIIIIIIIILPLRPVVA